ncbi:adenosylcobinamide amidohydrolase [Paenibacillus allorhizosphaerae]|uniref:Adenosylcobinamide amidohydrolase n=1 Tax=Paenibacillus allorhizosphaerae TaxID=2849866 RepID=A0ABM8VN80_9BACL|nr:adenosylcobinamide amidohydrolase [Paenibacillus allorhizosphaerae]CAG7650993.1 hypothetical protein PAECIP111802_04858 [Paenibacillus allorhizosphaerae]
MIPGLSDSFTDQGWASFFMIRSETPMRTLNSSIWGGGFGSHRYLMNRQVDKHYHCHDPQAEMHAFMADHGIDASQTAALLTAADLKDRAYETQRLPNGNEVCCWVTAGFSNKARAGLTQDAGALYPGTINTILVVDGLLTDAAFVNAVITATEAKTAALQDLGVFVDNRDGGVSATGTTTDAVLIASMQRGASFRYAGTATQLGYAIGCVVYEATMKSGARYQRRTTTHDPGISGQA